MKIEPPIQKLIERAWEARKNAYSPYFRFPVGSALLSQGGEIFTGVNVENASGSATACSEANALGAAVTAGARKFKAIAIVGPENEFIFPCGVCRQKLIEFAPHLEVYLAKKNGEISKFDLSDLLPHAFGAESLKGL